MGAYILRVTLVHAISEKPTFSKPLTASILLEKSRRSQVLAEVYRKFEEIPKLRGKLCAEFY